MNTFFFLIFVTTTTLTVVVTSTKVPKHIVFFLIDDYGFSDASYKKSMYNGTQPPPTPNLDKLAFDGIRLESHYTNKLCSPTRTALLSGRYAYTNGMDDGVIIDGQNIDLPLNLRTIADRLSEDGGWETSAYGKWDAGMTTWGSTPTCRGFNYFNGFYSAASDYYTHMVAPPITEGGVPGFDYHMNYKCDDTASGIYTTHRVTTAVQNWIENTMKKNASAHTFAYVAHEAVHGPLEVPLSYIKGPCERLIPKDHPIRRVYCGMVRAMDESVGKIKDTYSKLGILDDTLFILTGDNGGMPLAGGNNYPLRCNKATTFEGGVRSIAFISGQGIHPSLVGTVSHEIMHVTDWLPTIVNGVAGLSLLDNTTGRPCPTCTRPVAPLDGVNQWNMFSTLNSSSNREEVLLDLQSTRKNPCPRGVTNIPGVAAIRVGKWKLLHGHQSVYPCLGLKPNSCMLRGPFISQDAKDAPIPILENETNPWCPNGWTPPPTTDGYEPPQPPPDSVNWGGNCSLGKLPCNTPPNAGYVAGQTMLFDVVADMEERHNVAEKYPHVVQRLLRRLERYNNSHCGGSRCLPDNAGGKLGKPSTTLGPNDTPVWFPWRGDVAAPGKCDTNRTAPTTDASMLDQTTVNAMSPPQVPYLRGIFLSLYSIDSAYNQSQWLSEFQAMQRVGIEFVGIRAALQGTGSETVGGCVLGRYKAMYPTTLTPTICYQNDMKGKDQFQYILQAAKQYNIKIHITPVMPHTPFAWPHSPKLEYYDSLTNLQVNVFMDLWNMFPQYHDTIVGVYTSLEEWNGKNWMDDENLIPLAAHYFEPLAQMLRNQTNKNSLQIWASPYYVGNFTLHPTAENATSYAKFWTKVWKLAPSFDWIALQDSMGWQGNSFDEVKDVLIELEKSGKSAGKQVWSNVELFEGWPLPCEYPKKCGRHPAPIERIIKQLQNEDPYVHGHVAWEWMSCLSPNTNTNTSKLYDAYVEYLKV